MRDSTTFQCPYRDPIRISAVAASKGSPTFRWIFNPSSSTEVTYAIDTADVTKTGKDGVGANKRTATHVGAGAAVGAIIGAIAGGGKGARSAQARVQARAP